MFYCCLSVHRGIFYQGYLCSKCGLGAHKECLGRFGSCGKTGDALYTLLRASLCATLNQGRSASRSLLPLFKSSPRLSRIVCFLFFFSSFALLSSPCSPKLDRTFTVGQKNSWLLLFFLPPPCVSVIGAPCAARLDWQLWDKWRGTKKRKQKKSAEWSEGLCKNQPCVSSASCVCVCTCACAQTHGSKKKI